jgi:opacity protein-like surface antigen
MKKLPLLALVLALASAGPAHAAFYFAATGLYSNPSDVKVDSASGFRASIKSNTGFSGALGYKFSMLRVEAELQNLSSGTSGGSTTAGTATVFGSLREFSGFANAYVDVPSFLGLAPYAGVGLGEARIDLGQFNVVQGATNVVQFSGKGTAFAYQVLLGLQFHILGQATLHAGYRIVERGDISLRNAVVNASQNISLGQNKLFEIGVALGF